MRRVFAMLAVCSLFVAACGDDDAEPGAQADTESTGVAADEGGAELAGTITIGGLIEQSGTYAAIAEPIRVAMEAAVAQVNDGGGVVIDGERYEFELVTADTQSDTGTALAAATELVQDEGVRFLFGPTVSGLAPSVAQLVLPQDVLFFSPATALGELATPELVQDESKTLFLTKWSATQQGDVDAAAVQAAFPDAETVALVMPDDGTGRVTGPNSRRALEEQGVEVVAEEYYPADATDFQTVLTSVRGQDPDVLWVCCSAGQVNGLVRQAIELGFDTSLFVSNQQYSVFLEAAIGEPIPLPAAMDFQPLGLERLPSGDLLASRDAVNDYVALLESQGVELPPAAGLGFYYYDFIGMLAAAMEEAGTVEDTVAIAETLESITYDGIAGEISFLDDHSPDLEGDVCIYDPANPTQPECIVIPTPEA